MSTTMAAAEYSRPDLDAWMADPEQFPSYRAISAGMAFFSRVPVYNGPAAALEFLPVRMPADDRTIEHQLTFHEMMNWNMQWEGGPYRGFQTDELPEPLQFLRGLEAPPSKRPSSDIVLFPEDPSNIYEKWAALYHLLPMSWLRRYQLPVPGRGIWPVKGARWFPKLSPGLYSPLSRAFAELVWRNGLGPSGSPLGAFDRRESLVLLSHDLAYWRGPVEKLIRARCRALGRVPREDEDKHPSSIRRQDDLSFERPTYGTELWTGEQEAFETARELVDLADADGRLRACIDALRSHRVEDDFSPLWSCAREDFERKLYRKRSKVRISFVEFTDREPFHDADGELQGNILCRDLLALVEPRDRRIVVCVQSGATNVADIARSLGYANHTPVSKALARIRRRAAKLLDE